MESKEMKNIVVRILVELGPVNSMRSDSHIEIKGSREYVLEGLARLIYRLLNHYTEEEILNIVAAAFAHKMFDKSKGE